MNKPSPKTLTVWRVRQTLLAFVPAFALSLRYNAGSSAWRWAAGVFVLAFAGAYLFYLPARLKRCSYGLKGGKLMLTSGVFGKRKISLPLSAVQSVTVGADPVYRAFGLACVTVSAAGFRVRLPGLPLVEAKALARELSLPPEAK
jgi:membrane protein YdbS with pleckstrin-like domain